jgi:hypothetical protein
MLAFIGQSGSPLIGKAADYPSPLHPYFKPIFHCAIFGAAALQAILDLSRQVRLQEGLDPPMIDPVNKIGSDMRILLIVICKLEVTIHDGKSLGDAPIVQQTPKTRSKRRSSSRCKSIDKVSCKTERIPRRPKSVNK